jgi:hypothetical protein
MNTMKTKNEKGQALLFVVVAVTIALSVGVSISTRTLSSQRRVVSSDTATRVASAAEGGAEWALSRTYTELSALTSGTSITYPPTSGDNITATATVSAKPFGMNASDSYWFDLSPGMVKEIRLLGYTDSGWTSPSHGIYVCWENTAAAIYTLSYNSTGGIKKQYFVPSGFTGTSSNVSGFTSVGSNGYAYPSCAPITLTSSPYGLRIKTLYSTTRIHVYPGTNGTFPNQGYKITSIGELVSGGSSDVKETRVVVVYKSFPYSASVLDAGFYSTGSMD